MSHPRIITVYEIGCEPVISGGTARPDKVHYIAMELVDGDALADIIHDSKGGPEVAARLSWWRTPQRPMRQIYFIQGSNNRDIIKITGLGKLEEMRPPSAECSEREAGR